MASNSDFVHLHLHTEYSFLDGANKIGSLMKRAAEFKMPAVAMTDHGNLCGAVEFYKKAKEHGVKPILGCEVYVAPGSRHDRSGKQHYTNHLILLAKNATGYKNLCKLSTMGYLEGFYFRPRIDKEILKEHSEGLIALSACLKGEVSYLFSTGQPDAARKAAQTYKDIFPPGHFHLEIQENGLEAQRQVNARMCELSKDLGIPLAATADSHYLNPDDALAHKVLMYIGMNKNLAEGEQVETDLHFKGGELAWQQFSYAPEAVERTLWIADQCRFDFDTSRYHMPQFQPPEGVDVEAYFTSEARQGLLARFGEAQALGIDLSGEKKQAYEERLGYEIEVIRKMGFAGYFLIVSDFIRWAKDRGVPVGPGRGSAAGSLVAWALRITEVDPLSYGLVFERFLNPGRKSMPDIDVDFCMDRRGEVLDYITQKYGGRERVTQIITYGKLKAKAAIRDVGRVLGMPYGDVDRIAKLVPDRDMESDNPLNVTLERAVEMEPRLAEAQEKDPKVGQLLDLARRLEGLNRHASKHAAGVVIGDGPFTDHMGLYRTSDEDVVTQLDMKGVEELKFVKFDFLGLKTLTLIRHAEGLVRDHGNPDFDIQKIPLGDARVYKRLSEGDNVGVFQLESGGMRDAIMRVKPESIEAISDVLALYRPGPMEYIPQYADRKFGREKFSYPLPELQEILAPTYGIMVYQEQVIQIASKIAGFSPGEADLFRRAIGKKDAKSLQEQREKFVTGALGLNHPRPKVEQLFADIEKFANYGFNKSHSVAYALITYQTAYLKTHYPKEFLAALLTSEMDDQDKALKNLAECKAMGVEVLPPDVNESQLVFSVVGEKIRFGLLAIKGVGSAAIEAIVDSRKRVPGGRFSGLYQFCEETDLRKVNRKVAEALVKSGAFDSFGAHRAQLLAALDAAMETGQAAQRDKLVGQSSLFGAFAKASGTRKEQYPDAAEWPKQELLAYERECLGFYVTEHPLASYADALRPYTSHDTSHLADLQEGTEVRIGVLVGSLEERRTKRGDLFAKLQAEDQKGFVGVFVGSDLYARFMDVLQKKEPLVLSGAISRDTITGRVEIRARDFIPLAQAREKLSRRLDIRIDTARVREEEIETLKAILARHPGKCQVTLLLALPGGQSEVICGLSRRIAPSSELLQQVGALSKAIQLVAA